MRSAACAIDSSTNTYCYVEAAGSTHASDLYLYQLPLGLALPNTTVPSCSSCVQSVMNTFATGGKGVDKLAQTYASAAGIVNEACGSTFVANVEVGTSGAARAAMMDARVMWAMAAAVGAVGAALAVL